VKAYARRHAIRAIFGLVDDEELRNAAEWMDARRPMMVGVEEVRQFWESLDGKEP